MKERAGCEVVHEGSWEIQRWNRELTLKCKLNCYMKPMKDPLGVSSSKGNQGTTLTSLHIGHRRRDTYVLYVLECLAMEQLD